MNEITCREFDEIVHGFVRMELLDVDLRLAAIEHAAHCGLCADRMTEAAAVWEASEAASKHVQQKHAPTHVEAALLAAFRKQRRRAIWWRTAEWAGAGVAASLLAGILWTFLGFPKVQPAPSQRKDVSSPARQQMDASATESEPLNSVDEGADEEASSALGGESYSVSDFVPVPYTEGMGPEDAGMVVRVQLTRASLAELGYPVAETSDEDLIRADILVGEDGWPRGVRLVQ